MRKQRRQRELYSGIDISAFILHFGSAHVTENHIFAPVIFNINMARIKVGVYFAAEKSHQAPGEGDHSSSSEYEDDEERRARKERRRLKKLGKLGKKRKVHISYFTHTVCTDYPKHAEMLNLYFCLKKEM